MAIKSKGKTKQRSVARGPRREPVPVPKPFAQRRWVQLVSMVIVGVLVTLFVFWAWHGWRTYRANDRAAHELSTRQAALSQWKAILESQISNVGQLQSNVPPIIASDITAAVQALTAKKTVATKAADLTSSSKALANVAKQVDNFDLAGTITEQGFDLGASTALTSSKSELVAGLQLYADAGNLAVLAMNAQGSERAKLASQAQSLVQSASTLIEAGWNGYASTLSANGLAPGGQPPAGLGGSGLGSGLPAGGG